MDKNIKINFRYSPFFYYYISLYGILFFLIYFFSKLLILSSYSFNKSAQIVILTCISLFFFILLSFYLSFIISAKITDKKGVALFENNQLELYLKTKKIIIPYKEVKSIRYVRIPRYITSWFNLPRCRIIIKTENKKIILHSSFLEAWENIKKMNNQKQKGIKPRLEPHLYLVVQQISILSEIELKTDSSDI